MKKIFCAAILCCLCFVAFAQQQRFKEGDFEFYLEGAANTVEERAVIIGYTGGDSISIPGSLGSAAVKRNVRVGRIAADAFKGKGAISVDLNIPGLTIDNGAFADNPNIERITIADNLNVAPRSFDKNFPSYYNTTRGKAGSIYRYSLLDSKWMTNDEWVVEQARLRRENVEEARKRAEAEEARRKAEEALREARKPSPQPPPPPPPPPPSYDYDSDIDFSPQISFGWFMLGGYLDYLAWGLDVQAGFQFSVGDFAIDLLGYLDGGLSVLFLPTWGLGAIGELHFEEFGLGFGTGLAASMMELLNIDTTSDTYGDDDTETEYYKHRQYLRGALIFFADVLDSDKMTLYADYFLNSNWRFGITFHWELL